jgi:hypothetical protein
MRPLLSCGPCSRAFTGRGAAHARAGAFAVVIVGKISGGVFEVPEIAAY